MKSLTFLALFSVSAFAQTDASKMIYRLSKIDLGGNGSECSLYKFDVKKFDYSKELKEFTKDNDGETIILKWASALNVVEYYAPEEWKGLVGKLIKLKKVKAIFASEPDADICTESEYCSRANMDIFFTNGEKLTCYFDHTT